MASLQDAMFTRAFNERKREKAERIQPEPKAWWCEGGHGCVWTKPYRVEQTLDDAGNLATYAYCYRHRNEP